MKCVLSHTHTHLFFTFNFYFYLFTLCIHFLLSGKQRFVLCIQKFIVVVAIFLIYF